MQTYRYHGHSMSDPGTSYRTPQQVQEARQTKDCIKILQNIMLEHKVVTAEEIEKISDDAKELVAQASKQAINDPFPDTSDLT